MCIAPLMQRALAPQDMTAAQQREASEQLGKVAASLARGRRRLARRTRAATTTLTRPGRQPVPLTKVAADRRPFEGATMPVAAHRAAQGAGKGR
jgi:hypothetical protein